MRENCVGAESGGLRDPIPEIVSKSADDSMLRVYDYNLCVMQEDAPWFCVYVVAASELHEELENSSTHGKKLRPAFTAWRFWYTGGPTVKNRQFVAYAQSLIL